MKDFPSLKAIDPEFKNGWLTLWFNRPRERNSLSLQLSADLVKALEAARENPDVRGLTLRGWGGFFCAGGDLKSFNLMSADGDREEMMNLSRHAGALMHALSVFPKLTIAVVEGAAMAGGFGLACCCDIVICAADAQLAVSEAMIGLSPAQIAPYVVQRIGAAAARRLMLTGARLDGAQSRFIGFADYVGADTAELDAMEQDVRAAALKCAPGAVADIKELLRALPGLDEAERVEFLARHFVNRMQSAEGREGVAAFVEKRPTAWTIAP